MSFKFYIGVTGLCKDYLGDHNPRDKDGVFLKPAWAVDK
jgi:hypothetical protein